MHIHADSASVSLLALLSHPTQEETWDNEAHQTNIVRFANKSDS
jgi:hypothetical protein